MKEDAELNYNNKNNARKRKRLIVVKKKEKYKKSAANIFGIKTSTSSFFKINTIDKDLVELKKEKRKEIEMYVSHCFYQHIFPQTKITFQ